MKLQITFVAENWDRLNSFINTKKAFKKLYMFPGPQPEGGNRAIALPEIFINVCIC